MKPRASTLLSQPALTRSVGLQLGSHRALLSLMALTAVACHLRGQSAGDALASAVAVFLGWALVRELDPDSTAAALTAGLAIGAFELLHRYQHVDLMATAMVLLAVRVVLAASGRRLLAWDVALSGGAVWLAADSRSGLAASLVFVTGVAVHAALTARLRDRPGELPGMVGLTIGVSLLAGGAAVAFQQPLAEGVDPPRWVPLVALSTIGAMLLVWERRMPGSRCDSAGDAEERPLVGLLRLRAARTLNIIALAAVLAADATGAVTAVAPVWIGSCVAGGFVAARLVRGHGPLRGSPGEG